MAIVRPVTKTLIQSAQWGVPITDEVNALRTELNAMKPTAWTAWTMVNGWTTSVGGPAQYRKIGDNVQLRGVLGNGTPGTVVTTLPVGFRPYTNLFIATNSFTGGGWAPANLELLPSGVLTYHANAPTSPSYIDIGCTFSTIA